MIDFKRLVKSFHYALQGIHFGLKNEQNLAIHFIAGSLVMLAGFFLQVNAFEIAILGLTILFVISAEMVNTAIENMVDLITKEHREEARIAKDVSSGMVLLTAVGALIIGIIIFLPHVLKLF